MRLVVVSNRLPFSVLIREGQPRFRESAGGLTTGLASYLARASASIEDPLDYLWVGWPGASIPKEHQELTRRYGAEHCRALPVFLPEESQEDFYQGFCNRTLWPLFHYFPYLTRFEERYWEEYRRVNQAYADAVLEVLKPDDVLWVHDYQLLLVAGMVRQQQPDLPIGFFLHVPFPSFEVFRLLPAGWRNELIEGMLGANVVGFHTHDYTRHFLSCVLRTVGYEHQLGTLMVRDRVVKADTFPMGIDFERFARASATEETVDRVAKLREKCEGLKVIFSVDRLDYTKGVINRLRGYELFLKSNPAWHGRVVFILSVAPSRTGIESYQAMKVEIEQAVGRIVGMYGTVNWTPLIYQYRTLGFDELVVNYRLCDVALITPLRDGMNLVAKEFVASRPDQTGVLILSEMAGAAKEMGEALVVNPNHGREIAEAIEQALSLPASEQVRRNRLLQERLRRYDVNRWADEFRQALLETRTEEAMQRGRLLTGKAQTVLLQQYQAAERRAFLLDYDGTLVPFAEAPQLAKPDADVLALLKGLSGVPGNVVAMISGRPRGVLEDWFGHLQITLVAEHGAWMREPGEEWKMLQPLAAGWKSKLRPILQVYVDRLPGAALEEKEFSLAWHYRRADPEQATVRAHEMLDDLAEYTRNVEVQVLEGNKVIEVRNTGVTKGTAATEWLGRKSSGFILAVGDDWTDEDLFRALPPGAFSVRVGLAQTAARYYLGSYRAVRRLLGEMADLGPVERASPIP